MNKESNLEQVESIQVLQITSVGVHREKKKIVVVVQDLWLRVFHMDPMYSRTFQSCIGSPIFGDLSFTSQVNTSQLHSFNQKYYILDYYEMKHAEHCEMSTQSDKMQFCR